MRFPLAQSAGRHGLPQVSRHGMTLIEMLVAMTITLMIVFAMVRLFQSLGDSITVGRAAIERSGQLRNVLDRFQHDLDRLTVRATPPVDIKQDARIKKGIASNV